jgi:hypothetical protein
VAGAHPWYRLPGRVEPLDDAAVQPVGLSLTPELAWVAVYGAELGGEGKARRRSLADPNDRGVTPPSSFRTSQTWQLK